MIFVKLGMCVVLAQVLPSWCVVTKCALLIAHFHIGSDWLITTKANIQKYYPFVLFLSMRILSIKYFICIFV